MVDCETLKNVALGSAVVSVASGTGSAYAVDPTIKSGLMGLSALSGLVSLGCLTYAYSEGCFSSS